MKKACIKSWDGFPLIQAHAVSIMMTSLVYHTGWFNKHSSKRVALTKSGYDVFSISKLGSKEAKPHPLSSLGLPITSFVRLCDEFCHLKKNQVLGGEYA